jgi:hypothetical protein
MLFRFQIVSKLGIYTTGISGSSPLSLVTNSIAHYSTLCYSLT